MAKFKNGAKRMRRNHASNAMGRDAMLAMQWEEMLC